MAERLQHEAIIAADMDDLVTCPGCQMKLCVDPDAYFYDCPCGRRQCRNCVRPYDETHEHVSCSELDEQDKQKELEPKLSEIAVRVCHKCKLQFVKEEGCNKMECRCGAKQCYLCREPVDNYDHFCECGWTGTSGKCPECHKTCPLFGDADERDHIKMEEVKAQFDTNVTEEDQFNKCVNGNLRNELYNMNVSSDNDVSSESSNESSSSESSESSDESSESSNESSESSDEDSSSECSKESPDESSSEESPSLELSSSKSSDEDSSAESDES